MQASRMITTPAATGAAVVKAVRVAALAELTAERGAREVLAAVGEAEAMGAAEVPAVVGAAAVLEELAVMGAAEATAAKAEVAEPAARSMNAPNPHARSSKPMTGR